MCRRYQDVCSKNLPFLVAYRPLQAKGEKVDEILGFAYASFHHTRTAWRFTVEDSIYIDANHVRKGELNTSDIESFECWYDCPPAGVGRVLLTELINRCEAIGIRQMLARIGDSANDGSIGLHAALGFSHTGTLHAVGWKFDRWLDVVVMQRSIGAAATTPPVPN